MTQRTDGMTYAPKGPADRVVAPGTFGFAAVALDHGHIYGMTNGLIEAGADLLAVYDPDPAKVAAFLERYPDTPVADSPDRILADPAIALIASAAVPADRADLGIRALRAGKHYFTDKPPLTTLDQLARVRETVAETGKRYFCYFSERLHVEAAVYAGELVRAGRIGRVIQVLGTGPHRLNAPTRPDWFFDKERYGGILCDIGSHQIEQFLFFTGSTTAEITAAGAGNYGHPETPGLEDFGECLLIGDTGATGYFRVDWFTPDGLDTWGDGRLTILGTEGYIELRKYTNVATEGTRDHVFVVDQDGMTHEHVTGTVGFPFFGQMIRDCIDGTETAMTQAHIFTAAELCVRAQRAADARGFT